MGLTREDLVRKGRDLEISDEAWAQEYAIRKMVIDRYMSNDSWVKKTYLPCAVLITSHPGNRAYLKACIDTHRKLGLWICLAYDNYLHPDQPTIDYNSIMPAKDVMDSVDLFLMPHYQTWGGVLYPYFWQLKFAVGALKDFPYIYCTNGDFILEKPEGFPKLFSMIEDYDVMTSGPDYDNAANTAGFIIKTKAFIDVMKYIEDRFVPFENYEKYTQEQGNAEGRFGKAIKALGLKQKSVEPPLDDMFKVPGKGTWFDMLGFRHIHAEHNYAYRYKGIPPQPEYLDERFMGDEYRQIKAYWESKDKSILESWWCKDV